MEKKNQTTKMKNKLKNGDKLLNEKQATKTINKKTTLFFI
jgi:hypothetical protein